MNDSSLHPLARDYLKRLKKAAVSLPRVQRAELIEEIEAHLAEALPADASEAEALNALERLGKPEEIVAALDSPVESRAVARAGALEWAAVVLLLIGGFILGIGWFVGVVLLWTSRIWTVRDKLIGTLVVPGGLATVAFLFAFVGSSYGSEGTICSGNPTPVGPHSPKIGKSVSHCVETGSGGGVNYLFLALFALLAVLPVLTSIYLGRRANRLSTAASQNR